MFCIWNLVSTSAQKKKASVNKICKWKKHLQTKFEYGQHWIPYILFFFSHGLVSVLCIFLFVEYRVSFSWCIVLLQRLFPPQLSRWCRSHRCSNCAISLPNQSFHFPHFFSQCCKTSRTTTKTQLPLMFLVVETWLYRFNRYLGLGPSVVHSSIAFVNHVYDLKCEI